MKRAIVVILFAAATVIPPLGAEDDRERTGIEAAVADYLEGWFSSDAERMERALHPKLAKYIVGKQGDQPEQVFDVTAKQMVEFTGKNQDMVKGQSVNSVEIVFRKDNYAVVYASSTKFFDIINLAKVNGEWKILQVLWNYHEPAQP